MVPDLPPQIPRRGNWLSRWIGLTLLRQFGWRVEGPFPDVPRMVIIGAPHTSNMDALLGYAAAMAMHLKVSIMIKDSVFWWPLGTLLRWLGARPINRRSPKGIVEQSVDAFATEPQLLLGVTPEGTRKGASCWKSGFHRIARGAGVPILPVAIDYAERRFVIGPPIQAGEDFDADLRQLLAFIRREGAPRHPHWLSQPLRTARD